MVTAGYFFTKVSLNFLFLFKAIVGLFMLKVETKVIAVIVFTKPRIQYVYVALFLRSYPVLH
jgi:hypothetical protein